MTPEERRQLHELTRQLRRTHQTMFDLQGTMIDALHEALAAVKREHEQMMVFFQSVSDLEDLGDESQ